MEKAALWRKEGGNVDSSREGSGALDHFEKLISSPSYWSRGPAPGLAMLITRCVTLMISRLQTSASLCVKPEVDKGFTSPPTYLSSTPVLHQRTFPSLALGVWNSHPDLILWVLPHQIPICHFLTLHSFLDVLLSLSLCPTEYSPLLSTLS